MGVRARVGFRPTSPHIAAGKRIEPPPSTAWATGTMPAATAAAAPPELPPAEYSGFHGLRVFPHSVETVFGSWPNSGDVVLPKMLSPAAW